MQLPLLGWRAETSSTWKVRLAPAQGAHLDLLVGEGLPVLAPHPLHELHALIAAGVIKLRTNVLHTQEIFGTKQGSNSKQHVICNLC
jgi:hypothetical protein